LSLGAILISLLVILLFISSRDLDSKNNRSPHSLPRGARGGKKSGDGPRFTMENWDDAPLTKGPSSTTTTFSLSKDKELVKMQIKSLGKARGRGHSSTPKPAPVVGGGVIIEKPIENDSASKGSGAKYPAPKPGSKGITVIEPLDKGEEEEAGETYNQEQFEDASTTSLPQEDSVLEANEKPGLPLRGSGLSHSREGDNRVLLDPLIQDDDDGVKGDSGGVGSLGKNVQSDEWQDSQVEEGSGQPSGKTPPIKRSSGGGGGLPQQQQQPQVSKPKRYSSQRQKERTGTSAEQGEDEYVCVSVYTCVSVCSSSGSVVVLTCFSQKKVFFCLFVVVVFTMWSSSD